MIAAAALPPNDVLACACCSDPGDRFERTEPLADYTREVLLAVRFDPAAQLYADAGFPETVKGVIAPNAGAYRVAWSVADNRLLLSATDPAKAVGTISIALPRRISTLAFDPQNASERPNGPILMRIWRLDGDAELTGIFAAKQKRAKAQLILQGSGNRCATNTDFKSWTLELKARDVAFKLLGKTATK